VKIINWNKAKNLSIYLLFFINIFLFLLYLIEINKYNISEKQKKNIFYYLNKNNIFLKTDIPTNFSPKKILYVKEFIFDKDILIKNLLSNNFKKITNNFYINDIENLNINRNKIEYNNNFIDNNFILNKKNALKLTKIYKFKLGKITNSFKIDSIEEDKNIIIIKYKQFFNNIPIENSSLDFKITKSKLILTSSIFIKLNYKNNFKPIISSDKALFNLANHLKKIYGEKKIYISKIKLVYNQKNATEKNILYPYYKIFILKNEKPYLINLYNNIIY
jgi:hypothetical protein